MKLDRLSTAILVAAVVAVLISVYRSPISTGPYGPHGPHPHIANAVPYTTKDGTRTGWKLTIPDNCPLATPAVADGRVYLGGGFGSYEFYAFDAGDGKVLWQYHTDDDGPTAAVADGDYVAFNTESCELEVLTRAGKRVWKKWLGDPLMSMPAIADGKVFQAYPGSDPRSGRVEPGHFLAAFDLRTGKELWKQKVAGEVITAPVIAGGQIYLATVDGTLYCIRQDDGHVVWQEKKNATSAPVVWNGLCYFSHREEVALRKEGKVVKQQLEQLVCRGTGPSDPSVSIGSTRRLADYLDYAKRRASGVEAKLQQQDTSVGFAGLGNKGDSGMALAEENLGQASVAGVWSFQGSKPFLYKGLLYSCMGDVVQCVDPESQRVIWKQFAGKEGKDGEPLLDSVLTPPALANDKVFVGTAFGEIQCLSAQTGALLWKEDLGEPITFQPAVAGGRVYVPTDAGHLYCLETGDAADDGWLMWGAGPAHNGNGR
jgi:Ca-activated chloride channel family protein